MEYSDNNPGWRVHSLYRLVAYLLVKFHMDQYSLPQIGTGFQVEVVENVTKHSNSQQIYSW